MGVSGRRERWRELFLLPVQVVIVIVLSILILVSYRNTLETHLAERRREARDIAFSLARELEGRALSELDALELRRAPAVAVAVIDAAGDLLAARGRPSDPASTGRRVVTGTAPFTVGGSTLSIQVDLPAAHLLTALSGLEVFLPLVVLVDCALVVLTGIYLRRYLLPVDRLIRQARASGRMPASADEIGFLVETFEKALERLSPPAGDDLDALDRSLTKSVESGLLLLDAEGNVLALNDIGAALLGIEAPAPGTPLARLLEPRPALRTILLEAVREQRRIESREIEIGESSLGLSLHPLRKDDGKARGYLMFFFDRTAAHRQTEERRLAESLAQIGELSAGVAHEMRNSLATLRGYLTLIERSAEEADLSEYVREIRHETDQLKRVVDDFLTFARPGKTRMEKVDVESLLHRAAADPAMEGMAVRIANELPRERMPLCIQGDSQLLERAFRNLLQNAAEAERRAGREGPLEVGLGAAGGDIEIAIRDRGPGLPEEDRSRLFHPFVSHRPGGAGLGLSLANRILRLHRGSVRLLERRGGGVEARVRLRSDDPPGVSVTHRNRSA